MFSFTFKNEKATYQEILNRRETFVSEWKDQSPDGDFYVHGIFQAIPTLFAKHSVEKDNAVLFQVQMMVKGTEQEEKARSRLSKFFRSLKQYTVEVGGDVDWEYLNYADYTQDPLKTYGTESVAFLKKVAEKYDPAGVFQMRVPGGFKISEVE